jgi:hypothetical protein
MHSHNAKSGRIEPDYYSIPVAARRVSMHPGTLRKFIRMGDLGPVCVIGRNYFLRADVLKSWMEKHQSMMRTNGSLEQAPSGQNA